MKKVLSLFMLLFTVLSGAWAQTVVTTPQVSTEGATYEYTFECQSGYSHSSTRFIGLNEGSINGQCASTNALKFQFETATGGYHIFTTVQGEKKYFNFDSGASLDATASTVWEIRTGFISNTIGLAPVGTATNKALNNNGNNNGGSSSLQLWTFEGTGNACSHWEMKEYATTVVARMQDFVNGASISTASVSTAWETSVTNGAVYDFSGGYLGNISCDAVANAYAGNQIVTVAMWVYGRPGGTAIFGYGAQDDGIMLKCSGNTMQMTTKGVQDVDNQVSDGIITNQWNLIAYSFPGASYATKTARYYVGTTESYDRANVNAMGVPATNNKKFAIGSGNCGTARDKTTGIIANVTVLTSSNLLSNAEIAEAIGAAPTRVTDPEYYYSFTNTSIPNAARKINSATIGGVTVDFTDNNNMVYNDNTTKTFQILKSDVPLTVKFQLNGGSWIHGYLYIDLNKDKHFTVSDPEEMVAKSTNQSSSPDLAQTSSWNTFACPAVGTYRMRLKTDWANTDPAGSNGIELNQTSGQIIDVMLEVIEPDASITYDYYIGSEKVATEQLAGTPGEDYPDPTKTFPFYTLSNKPSGKVSATETCRIDLTWDGPFVADGTTTYALGVRLKADGNANYYVKSDGTNAPTRTRETAHNSASYLWMFERVTGTADQFYLKNLKYGYINTNTNSASTMNATTKTAMKLGEYTGTNHQNGNKDFYLIDASNSTQVFGDHKTANNAQVLGYWNNGYTNNEGSAFQAILQTEVAPDWEGLAAIVTEAESYTIGTGYGEYTDGSNFGFALNQAQTMLNNHENNPSLETTKELVDEAINDLRTAINNLTINAPQPGSFILLKGNSNKYLTLPNANTYAAMAEDGDIICYTKERTIVSYKTGLGIYNTHTVAPIGTNLNTIGFSKSDVVGKYFVQSNATGIGTYFYDGGNTLNRNTVATGYPQCRWTIEKVNSLPVRLLHVDNACWATFYAPVAVTIPSGVAAYSATVNGNTLVLEKVVENGDLAAETPVILYSEGESTKEVRLNIADSGNVAEDNAMAGTVAAKNEEGAWVLNATLNTSTLKYENIGFYKTKESESYKINGFKAYLPASTDVSVQKFSFDFNEEMTTAIRAIESENSGAEIFDINGNCLKQAQKGMNIINGHKVLVK